MLREAIDTIAGMAQRAQAVTLELAGQTYYSAGGDLRRLKPPAHTPPTPVTVSTLQALADLVDGYGENIYGDPIRVVVDGPGEVRVIGELQPENDNVRFMYATAELSHQPFGFGRLYDLESFIVAIQCLFVPSETVQGIIDTLGHLANEVITENVDDGFSQTVQVRVGITEKAARKIENPVLLRPYRTFREVEQPEVPCILRLKKKDGEIFASLHEAGGDTWKIAAVENIQRFLRYKVKVPVLA